MSAGAASASPRASGLATSAGGATTSLVSSINVHWSLQGVDGSLGLEQSIPLNRWMTALFRAGGSYGLRDYDIEVPHEPLVHARVTPQWRLG